MNKRQLKKKRHLTGCYKIDYVGHTLVQWSDGKIEWIDNDFFAVSFNRIKLFRSPGHNHFQTAKSAKRAVGKIPGSVILLRFGRMFGKDKCFLYPPDHRLKKKNVSDALLEPGSLLKFSRSVYAYDSLEPEHNPGYFDTAYLFHCKKNTHCFIIRSTFQDRMSLVCLGDQTGWVETRFLMSVEKNAEIDTIHS